MWAAYKDPDEFGWQEPIRNCKHCADTDEKFEDAQKYLKIVIAQLYSHKDLDRNAIEQALDELCDHLEVPMCRGDLMIERFQEVWHI